MADYLDFILILVAGVALYKRPTDEMLMLFIYFTASSAASLFLYQMGVFDYIGVNWFVIYAVWLLIFAAKTQSLSIAALYCAQQILCLLVVLQWNTSQVMLYNLYSYLIAVIYLTQLSCAYGHNNSNNIDKHNGRHFYLAHNEAW